jgi:hypothetical protein
MPVPFLFIFQLLRIYHMKENEIQNLIKETKKLVLSTI